MFRVPERTSIEPRKDTNHMAMSLESGTYEEVKEYLERNGCIVTGRPGYDRCIYFDYPERPSFAALLSWREWVGSLCRGI